MAVIVVPTTIDTNVVGTNADDQLYSIVDPLVASTGGNQTLYGGLGNDTYILGNTGAGAAGDVVVELGGEGIDTVVLYTNVTGAYTLANNVENLINRRQTPSFGTGSAATTLTGNNLNNVITVEDGPGNTGSNDVIDGGLGNDTMNGGLGNDSYTVDSTQDVIVEAASAVIGGILTNAVVNGVVQNGFIDSVNASVTYTLGLNVENLTLTGALNINGTGNALANNLTGNAGNNTLDGGDGNDMIAGGGGNDTLKGGGGDDLLDGVAGGTNATMDGGAGNDVYRMDSAADTIIGDAGGVDAVQFTSSATFNTYVLPVFIENVFNLTAGQAVMFTGNAFDNNLYGNTGADTLIGGDGNDILDGSGGIDSLSGGKGNDVYVLDQIGDVVMPENAAEGIDTVYVTLTAGQTWTLGNNFERLFLTGTANANGTGNALDNAIGGNSGNNTLIGGAGNDNINGFAGTDQIAGGVGNDVLDGDVGNDTISGSAGLDTIRGGDGNDWMEGGADNDILDGGAGFDFMNGGAGNDVYFVGDRAGTNPQTRDIVFELPNSGIDTVNSSVSIDLLFDNVENLNLTGINNIDGIGNILGNVIVGNIGNNVLDAGRDLLNDSLVGGIGNDTYIIYGTNDAVNEVANVLIGTAIAPNYIDNVIYRGTANYTLAANVENLALDVGIGNVNAVGNVLNNNISGSAGANLIDGSGGNDMIAGGGGNDTLVGGIGNDTLSGQLGTDSLVGGAGDDTILVESTSDIVDELGGGIDTVISYVKTINLDANPNMKGAIENITLGGGALNAIGNDLANTIRGNALANSLTGGKGNDIYFADLSDQIVEAGVIAVGGTDTVNLDVGNGTTAGTITVKTVGTPDFIPSGELWNVENVTLLGTNPFNIMVDRASTPVVNILVGNDGNNILDAGDGADSMSGGKGNDTFWVDNVGDKTIELAGQGTDTVFSTVNWTLALETENLNLVGPGNLTGTGNISHNYIRGNGFNNTLSGLAGNDTIDGLGGNDAMNGADGDDTYWVDSILDTVADTTGTDTVISTVTGPGGVTLAANVENMVLFNGWAIAPAIMNATGNLLDNRITGNLSSNTIDGGAGSDTFDFNIVGTLSASDSLVGGLGTDTVGNDTLLADITGLNITATTREIETVYLRAEGGVDGTIQFADWSDIRAVNFTGSAGRTLTVTGVPHTGFVNNAVSGTPLVFGFEDYNGAAVSITGDNVTGATDALNIAIRDSGLSSILTTANWETIRVNNMPSPGGAFSPNTLDLSGVTTSGNKTVVEVTGSGGGQLNLTNMKAVDLSAGSAFNHNLQITVLNYSDRLQLRETNGGVADTLQVNVRDSSFWLDAGFIGGGPNADSDFETIEIFALGPSGTNPSSTSFVHLNEASTVMNGTLSVGGAANSNLTIDGIRASTINASTFAGSTLNLTAESTTAGTWTGPTASSVVFNFTGGGGADTFNLGTGVDGLDLVDGGAGNDTVNVTVTDRGVSGTAMNGGLHFSNTETVNMTNTGGTTTVVDASMMDGNVVMAGGAFTSLTINGLAGNFNGSGLAGNVTIYSRAAGGQTFSGLGTGTYTLFGSQGQGVPADTFTFGGALDDTDYVQAFDFDPANPDVLSATLNGVTLTPTILGVETIQFTSSTGPNTVNAANVVGAVTWTLTGTQALTLSGLNGVSGAQLWVNAGALSGALNVTGSAGDDSITGGTGANGMIGGEGDDTLIGGAVSDTLLGGNGNDSLIGGLGSDILLGEAGNDILFGATATDAVADTMMGGAGTGDAVDYNGATAVNVNLTTDVATGYGSDTLSGIERVRGSSANDTLTGGAGQGQSQTLADYAEIFTGRGGNDIISGGSPVLGGDVAITDYSPSGNAVIVNLGGSSIINGAVTVAGGTAADFGGGSSGVDTLTDIDGAFGSAFGDTLVGGSSSLNFGGQPFEIWRGNGGNDIIAGSKNALSTALSGTGTVDTTDFDLADYQNDPNGVVVDLRLGIALDGFGGTDTLFDITHVRGSAFDDYLIGGNALNDSGEFFEGNAGNDHIDGGTGFDTARYVNAESAVAVNLGAVAVNVSVVVDGNTVPVALAAGTAWDGNGGIDSFANVEAVDGSDFNDTVFGSANADQFAGMKGDDLFIGGLGDDVADYRNDPGAVNVDLSAFSATDGWGTTDNLQGVEDVRGSQFSDMITGDGNANRLDGGRNTFASSGNQGNDMLTGGGGADSFVFQSTLDATNNLDTILDFVSGTDKIELDDAIFAAFVAPGPVAVGNLVVAGGAVAGDADDYLLFDSNNGNLYYDADGNGGGAAVQIAQLTGVVSISETDFVVF